MAPVIALSTNIIAVGHQDRIFEHFTETHGFKLNLLKRNLVRMNKTSRQEIANINGQLVPVQRDATCLGYNPMSHDLSATKAIEENIAKARRCFFARGGLGNFQGKLNPCSSKSIYETCVLPVLLYGCKNWLINQTDFLKLEKFQCEIG